MRKITMILLVSILLIIIVVVMFMLFVRPQMGSKPTAEHLNLIQQSANYKGGIFVNPVSTIMTRPPNEAFREMMKMGDERTPLHAIETQAIETERYLQHASEKALITWLGHSSFLIKIKGITMLVDPVLSKRASLSDLVGPKKFPYTIDHHLDDFPPVDLLLLTHDHYDHLDHKLVKALSKNVSKILVPLGLSAHLVHWGIDKNKIIEFDWWNELNIEVLTITATPGRHFSGRSLTDRFKTLWCGWAINSGTEKIYISGDSGYFDGFKTIGEKLGPFDFAMLECGQYSRFWPDIHMAPKESAQAAIDVKASKAMPMHWGKFKLSIHAWNEPPLRFVSAAEMLGVETVIPKIGQAFSIDEAPFDEWYGR